MKSLHNILLDKAVNDTIDALVADIVLVTEAKKDREISDDFFYTNGQHKFYTEGLANMASELREIRSAYDAITP